MFAKDRDRSNPSVSRPVVPKLAANNAFAKSPPTAPRLAAPFSSGSSPSNGVNRPRSFPASTAASSPPTATPISAALPGRYTNKPNGSGSSEPANVTPRTAARNSKLSNGSSTPRGAAIARSDAPPRSPTTSARNPTFTATNPLSSPSSLKIKSSPATPTGRNGVNDIRSGQRGLPLARAAQISPTPLRQTGAAGVSTDLGQSFFHASDAPSYTPPPSRPALPKQSSSFVYANGQRNVSQEEPPSEVASVQDNQSHQAPPAEDSTPSFAHMGTTSPPFKLNSSPPSAFHRPTSASSAPVAMQVYNSISPKPPSPQKQDFHLSYRKGASQIIRPPESRPPLPETTLSEMRLRQVSLDTVSESLDNEPTHARTMSISSQSLSGVPGASPQDSPETTNPKPTLAAQARQERKVLDLEISNSSLLAINRSLEREVRRQKIEIRRYRRLSRNSNRISWLSDATNPDPLDEDIIEEESEEEENSPSDEFGLDDVTDPDSVAEDALSPLARAQSDQKHLRSDQKRLQLDLSKHKQLLVDSQKMNGSLKRCLGLSEQLLKDAGKALEYKVNVADVRLGGRVLSPEEVGNDSELANDSNNYFYSKWRNENDRLSAASQRLIADWDGGTDKDSGVDIEYSRQSQDAVERDGMVLLTHSDALQEETF